MPYRGGDMEDLSAATSGESVLAGIADDVDSLNENGGESCRKDERCPPRKMEGMVQVREGER